MKRALFALTLAIALLLAGCGEVSTTNGGDSTESAKQEESAKEKVIFDNDKVKVTYTGIKEIDVKTVGYSYLNLKIENKTDTEVRVMMPYCSVDEEVVPFVIQGATTIYIKPGKTFPATFGIQMFNLSIDSLKNAKEIEFTLKAVDKDNIIDVIFEETMKIEFNK